MQQLRRFLALQFFFGKYLELSTQTIYLCQHNNFMKAKKTAILHMRLTPEDKNKLEEMAQAQQKSISSLITKIINNEHNNQGAIIATNHRPSERNEGSKKQNRIRKAKRTKQVIER